MLSLLNRVLQVRSGEWRLVAVSAGFTAVAIAATVVLTIINNSMFLAAYDRSFLAYGLAASSLGMATASVVYGSLAQRLDRRRLALTTPVLFALILVVCRLLASLGLPGYVFAQYVVIAIIAGLTPILAWNTVRNASDPRQFRRLIPLFSGAASGGAVVAGQLTSLLSKRVGTEDLLFLGACLLGILFVLTRASGRAFEATGHRKLRRPAFWQTTREGVGLIYRNHLMRFTTVSIVFAFVVVAVLEYQFLASVQARFAKDEMASFLGNYRSFANAITFSIQIFVSGWLMNRFGLTGSFAVRPIAVIVLGLVVVISPGFWSFVVLRFMDWILTIAWYELGANITFAPIPAERGNRIKLTQDGAIRPLVSTLTLALIAALMPHLQLAQLTWIPIGVAVVWLVWSLRIRRVYVRELAHAMDTRLFAADQDARLGQLDNVETVECVSKALASGDAEQIKFALSVAQDADSRQLWDPVRACLDHPDDEVRCSAATALIQLDRDGACPVLRDRLRQDGVSSALAAHLLACLTEAEDEDALELAYRWVDHGELVVRSEALVMLFRLGGLDGIIAAGEQISALRRGDEHERAALAWIVGRLGVGHLDKTLSALLHDPEREVRDAALTAAAATGSEALLQQVAAMLERAESRDACERALYSAGPRGVEAVRQAVTKQTVTPALAASAARVFRASPSQACLDLLREWMTSEASGVRREVFKTLGAFKDAGVQLDWPPVREAFDSELRLAYALKAAAERETGLLRRELDHRFDQCIDRLFLILGLMYESRDVDGAQTAIASGEEKVVGNALEFLDNTLRDAREKLLIPLLEKLPIAAAYEKARPALSLPPSEKNDVRELARHDAWLRLLLDEAPGPDVDPERFETALQLADQPLFQTLDLETLYAVAQRGEFQDFPPEQVLCEQGQPSDTYYLILNGRLEMVSNGRVVRTLAAGEGFGDVEVLANDVRPATARCAAETRGMALTREDFDDLMSQHGNIAAAVIAFLLAALRASSDEESRLRGQDQEAS